MTKVNKAKEALVDQEFLKHILFWDDVSNVFRWLRPLGRGTRIGSVAGCIDKSDGYRRITIKGVLYQAHRLVWLYHYNEWPEDQIDHIDGDKLNNHIDNLRVVTQQENRKNQKIPRNNTSGVTGVYFAKHAKKWCARIQVDDKLIHLGYFDNFEDAVAARKAAEILYGFHENHGRNMDLIK